MTAIDHPYRTGRIAVLANLPCDTYARAGIDPIEADGLSSILGADPDAVIIAGDFANGPPEARPA
jgi:hypothetical protein